MTGNSDKMFGHRPLIKVCGLTRSEDARLALDLGAAFLGLILTTKSPRHLPMDRARGLVADVRESHGDGVRFVGVFVDEPAEAIAEAREKLGFFAVQLHGDSTRLENLLPRREIMPARGIKDEATGSALMDLHSDFFAIVADAFSPDKAGGTGKLFDHQFVQPLFARRRIFLAGGLRPENIGSIIDRLGHGPQPFAFDLSSGIEESPGVKSPERMRRFFGVWSDRYPSRSTT